MPSERSPSQPRLYDSIFSTHSKYFYYSFYCILNAELRPTGKLTQVEREMVSVFENILHSFSSAACSSVTRRSGASLGMGCLVHLQFPPPPQTQTGAEVSSVLLHSAPSPRALSKSHRLIFSGSVIIAPLFSVRQTQRKVFDFSKPLIYHGLSRWFSGKESASQCRRHRKWGFNTWIRKIPWRNGNPLQYSCLENPMDRGAWRATVHGVANSWT